MKITPEESKKRKLTFNIGDTASSSIPMGAPTGRSSAAGNPAQNMTSTSGLPKNKRSTSPILQKIWGIVPAGKPLTIGLAVVVIVLIALLITAAVAYQAKPQTATYPLPEGAIMIEPAATLNEEARSYLSSLIKAIGGGSKIDVRKITDINQIRQTNPESGDFYATAQNGDVLIIVIDIGGAFIIRPSENKVVNFSRISVSAL